MEFSHKHNFSMNNLPDKSMIVQYSICNFNWQNFTFWNWTHSRIQFKPKRLAWQRLRIVQYSV